jgi:hypothetical protein
MSSHALCSDVINTPTVTGKSYNKITGQVTLFYAYKFNTYTLNYFNVLFYAFFYAFKEGSPFKCIEKSIGCVATPPISERGLPPFLKWGGVATHLYR